MKRVPVKFNCSHDETLLIIAIVARASREFGDMAIDSLGLAMDLTMVHLNDTRLDLSRLAEAPHGDFVHDIAGIQRHVSRQTGRLDGSFTPRLRAVPQGAVQGAAA